MRMIIEMADSSSTQTAQCGFSSGAKNGLLKTLSTSNIDDQVSASCFRNRLKTMKIAIGSDHAGFRYKEIIKAYLTDLRHEIIDFGTDAEEPVDYPLFIRPVALAVANGEVDRGVGLGGSGNGEAMCANRIKGVRCALCWNVESARLAREHNDANMISLGQRLLRQQTAMEIVRIWLETPFAGGRHVRRIQLLDMERPTAAENDQR
jgi:ribose 5-phosphate isomerase B